MLAAQLGPCIFRLLLILVLFLKLKICPRLLNININKNYIYMCIYVHVMAKKKPSSVLQGIIVSYFWGPHFLVCYSFINLVSPTVMLLRIH